jgi:hypothetical protein
LYDLSLLADLSLLDGRLLATLSAQFGEFPDGLCGPGEDRRTLLAMGVAVATTLLGTRFGGSCERPGEVRCGARRAGHDGQHRLGDLDDILAPADALDHVRVGVPDTLVGTPASDRDRLSDGVQYPTILLWELAGVSLLTAELTAGADLTADAELTAGADLVGRSRLLRGLCALLWLSVRDVVLLGHGNSRARARRRFSVGA